MAQEMQPEWNIRFLTIAPGTVRTNFISALKVQPRHPAYDTPSNPVTQLLNAVKDPALRTIDSDPNTCAKLLFDTVAGNYDKPFPRRVLMGSDSYYAVKQELETTLQEVELWRAESESCSSK
jgi:NAD(P)-dependent dehydrogenase (short-subunit alcohol dehydrogenase family)